MRVMIFGKATADTEKGVPPTEKDMEEMGKFYEELVQAGILKDGSGLKPSSAGKRIVFEGSNRTVIDGPFTEARELIAGYSIWEVKDMDEAVAWAKRCPNPGGRTEMEIRPLFVWEPDEIQKA